MICVTKVLTVALAIAAAGVVDVSAARAEEAPPKLLIDESDQAQTILFDAARGTKDATFTIRLDPPPAEGETPVTPAGAVRSDLKSAQNRRLKQRDVKVTNVEFNGVDGFSVTLEVTANDVKPGRYVGTVVFGGRTYTAVPVTVAATLRSGELWAFGLAMLGFVGGVILKALTDLFRAGTTVRSWASVEKYVIRSGFIPTVALGFLGAIATWGYVYFGNDVWGAGALDDLKLAGAALAGVVTGTNVADFFAPFKATTANPS